MPDQASKEEVLSRIREDKRKRDEAKALEKKEMDAYYQRQRAERERKEIEKKERDLDNLAKPHGHSGSDIITRTYAYEYGSRPFVPEIGDTFRDRTTGLVYKVIKVDKPWRVDEGRSFGYQFDDGYAGNYYAVPASPKEEQEVVEQEQRINSKNEAKRFVSDLGYKIRQHGTTPSPSQKVTVKGISLCDLKPHLRLYGGGEEFVIEDGNRRIWYIRNNSAGGDDWGASNTNLNEIASYIPFDQDIADKLLECHEILIGKRPERRDR